MNLNDKIELVKSEMTRLFPNCFHTIKILIWDDDTDSVSCRHATINGIIHNVTYYNNELTYESYPQLSNMMIDSASGNEFFVLTQEEYLEQFPNNI